MLRLMVALPVVIALAGPGENESATILKGHSSFVLSVEFSSDGKILASASADKTVKLWDVASNKELHTLKGHDFNVNGISFSGDDRFLASCGGSDEPAVIIWNVKAGKQYKRFECKRSVMSVAWIPNGNLVAFADSEGVHFRDIEKDKELARLDEDLAFLKFSPDGKTLASGDERDVLLWEASDLRLRQRLRAPKGRVTSLAFLANGSQIVAGVRSDETVRFWRTDTGKELRVLSVGDITRAMAVSPDGKRVATGYRNGLVRIWDVESGKCAKVLEDHKDENFGAFITGLAFSPDGSLLASASHDKTVRIWDLKKMFNPKKQRP